MTLEVKDEKDNLVRTFSSKKDPSFIKYDGGPSAEPTLTVKKGVNRFVWNMRYPTMPGVPTAYLEASFSGHKAVPGSYTLLLKSPLGVSTNRAKIVDNPDFGLSAADYQEYHAYMSKMEAELTSMHTMINEAMAYQKQLKPFLDKIKGEDSKKELHSPGANLLKEIQAWDEDMVQRKSQAYDDVENFPNKFAANYLYLINQTESSIPRVNQGSKERLEELTKEWEVLKSSGEKLLKTAIPAYNKSLQDAGIGVLYGM